MINDDYPIVPHPIVRSQIEPNKLYYVGDGDHFVLATYTPYMSHRVRAGHSKRGTWVHGNPTSPWYEKRITIEPRYVLDVEEAFVKSLIEDQIVPETAASRIFPETVAPLPDDDRWECGSDALIADLALRLIVRNKIKSDFHWLEGQISAAGPRACRAMLGQLDDEGCPF